MPSFDEFLKTVDSNEIQKIANESSETFENPISASSRTSTLISFYLLRQYHEWLSQQLDELR